MNDDQLLPAPLPSPEAFRSTLLALLESDEQVRQAVLQLLVPPNECSEVEPQDFGPERELLGWLDSDPALRQAWLNVDEPLERQLVRLIAVASQWDRLLLLWDHLAARCKEQQRGASVTEANILGRSLALHNLVWKERQASLQAAQAGSAFDPLVHERGTLLGDRVSTLWLPGLRNAAGQLQRKPLVGT